MAKSPSIRSALYAAMTVVALATSAQAAENPLGGTFSLTIENDKLVNTDRHYTNGFRLGWVSDKTTSGPEEVRDALQFLYPVADLKAGRIGFSLGHTIFTPENVETRNLVPNDRPYAGWLFVGASLHAETSHIEGADRLDMLDSVEMTLGIVGPHAYGKEIQNTYHHVIDVDESNGWDHQLKDEPAINFVFERRWRPLGYRFGSFEADAIPHIGGSLGNVFTFASTGAILRVGQGIKRDYGPAHIQPSMSGLEAIEPWEGLSWYLFGGVEGRTMLHNIFLDGNTFADSHSVDRNILVGDSQFGLAIAYGQMRAALAYVIRTKEFDGQKENDQFGALNVSWHF